MLWVPRYLPSIGMQWGSSSAGGGGHAKKGFEGCIISRRESSVQTCCTGKMELEKEFADGAEFRGFQGMGMAQSEEFPPQLPAPW